MRLTIGIFTLTFFLLAGCSGIPWKIDHQKGGGTSMSIPQDATPPPPPYTDLVMAQPENPEGSSTLTYKQTKTLVHPDGTVESTTTETGTEIGGSQDFVGIAKAYAKTDQFKGLLMALLLLLCAYRAHVKGWETVTSIFVLGACASIFFFWWAGLLAFPAAVGVVYAYNAGALAKLMIK